MIDQPKKSNQEGMPGDPDWEADYSGTPAGDLDYDTKRKIAEEKIGLSQYIGLTVPCPKGIHKNTVICHACAHCLSQDPVHPEGMYYFPEHYYVCKTCFGLIERRKFDFWHNLYVSCWPCIMAESQRISLIDPGLVVDLRLKK
jgi:hypothetical protein